MLDIDNIIARLSDKSKGPGKQVHLEEEEIKEICLTSLDIFMKQDNLLYLGTYIYIYIYIYI